MFNSFFSRKINIFWSTEESDKCSLKNHAGDEGKLCRWWGKETGAELVLGVTSNFWKVHVWVYLAGFIQLQNHLVTQRFSVNDFCKIPK